MSQANLEGEHGGPPEWLACRLETGPITTPAAKSRGPIGCSAKLNPTGRTSKREHRPITRAVPAIPYFTSLALLVNQGFPLADAVSSSAQCSGYMARPQSFLIPESQAERP